MRVTILVALRGVGWGQRSLAHTGRHTTASSVARAAFTSYGEAGRSMSWCFTLDAGGLFRPSMRSRAGSVSHQSSNRRVRSRSTTKVGVR
jgi:hypothetical protein